MKGKPAAKKKGHGVLGKVAWRFAVGKHLDGKARSDATFFASGTYAHPHYWGRGGESKWALQPGWRRALIRWSFILVPAGLAVPAARAGTEWALALIFGPLAGWYAIRAVAVWRALGHYRTKIVPLHQALAPVLDIPLATRPRTWLTVPHDYDTRPDARITVYPPDGFTASDRDKEEVTRAVTAKLGIEAPEADWAKLHGRKPQITFSKSEPPPAKVSFADIRLAVEAAESHEVVLGLGKKAQAGVVSVDNDSPHIGLSMGSGDGKSTVAKNIGAQLLHHGALLMVLDYKLISHMWARGLPNVSYAGTPEEIESALVWLAAEVTRRNRVALAGADIEGRVHADVGPRILLIAEELNATQNRLKAWWHQLGERGRSPGSQALDEVMFLGRQVHINVLQIGQRLSVKASGSGDARENLGVLVFSDPTAAAWKMLCPQHVMPAATGHLGRLQVVTRKSVREIQGAFLTGEQAREFALSGTVAVPRPDMPCVTSVGPVPGHGVLACVPSAERAIDVPQPPVVQGPPAAVTLREAVDAGLFKTIEAARKTAQRYEFQAVGERNQAKLYDLGDLHAFLAGKRQRKVGTR